MRSTLLLLGVIIVACITGTVWPAAAVFHAWWFLALVGALAASLLACGARQSLALRGARGAAAGRLFGSLLLHGSLIAVLVGAAMRDVAGQRGTLRLHTGEATSVVDTDRGPLSLPFDVTLQHFTIETHAVPVATHGHIVVHWPGATPTVVPVDEGVTHTVRPPGAATAADRACTIRVVRLVPDFVLDRQTRTITSLSNEPRNPAAQIEVTAPGFIATNWYFANFPGFRMPRLSDAPDPFQLVYQATPATPGGRAPIRNFRSRVAFSENGRVARSGDIAVNAPLTWRGYTFYQAGYNPDDLDWTSLQVVRDPGVPVVFAGFGMLLAGLFLMLFVWPKDPSA
jgi:hypothetical protein